MNILIDDLKINYIDEGHGKNVLLLHGWGASIQSMLPIFNMLKNKCRVVALDLPGFGESSVPMKSMNSFDYANVVKKFIDTIGLTDIVLIGHSHGGRVSIIISSMYRDLVDKLVLIDSAGIIPKRTLKYYYTVYRYKLLKKIYLLFKVNIKDKNKYDKFIKKYSSTDYYNATNEVMRQTLVKVIHDNVKPLLKYIKASTLIIWGDKDLDTPLYMAKVLNKNISDSGLVVLEGAKHYSYADSFNKFKLVLESFLKDCFN